MEEDSRKKEVKQLVYLLIALWIFSIAAYAYVFMAGFLSFGLTTLVVFVPLVLTPLLIIGLWKTKKWGLMLGYALYLISLANGVLTMNIIQIAIPGIILYFLYKRREIFS